MSTLDVEREVFLVLLEMQDLEQVLEGCDWCCGGGDEHVAELWSYVEAIEAGQTAERPGPHFAHM